MRNNWIITEVRIIMTMNTEGNVLCASQSCAYDDRARAESTLIGISIKLVTVVSKVFLGHFAY